MDGLKHWTVISLRPASQQAAIKRDIAARGATPLGLPALRLAPMPDATAAASALRAALQQPMVLFTSPAAVRFAARLQTLKPARGQRVYAVGRGTARALGEYGLPAIHPGDTAMRSEGLLALPDFARKAIAQAGGGIGLVTAPGGRGLIRRALRARGARVHLAEVYRRLAPRLDRRHADAVRACQTPCALLLTSAEALDNALAALPEDARTRLQEALVVASSARLVQYARGMGFERVIDAGAPTPDALLDALQACADAAPDA